MRLVEVARWTALAGVAAVAAGAAYVWRETGTYGFNVIARRGASLWTESSPTDPRLTDAMRLALKPDVPAARSDPPEWRTVADGLDVAEMPVRAGGALVDTVLLTRIDPTRYRFEVRNGPSGDREPLDWSVELGAAFVINASYFNRRGLPDTPFLQDGKPLGPASYDARHGAFVADANGARVVDLAGKDWKEAFAGATDATVSYPMLIGDDGGTARAKGDPRWLANRSFVGQDAQGKLVFGTTKDAFFSLPRLAEFLASSPLGLSRALNLDGGPLACQGVEVDGYERDFCGEFEMSVRDGRLSLLRPMLGSNRWGLAVVIAAVPR